MDTEKFFQIGDSLSKEFVVEAEHTAEHLGSGLIKVLATPMMIAFMEITARMLLDSKLPEGYSSVGTHVDVRHLAPTALGKQVLIKVEITSLEGNLINLDVSAWEGESKVGAGSHKRFVIEVARFLAGLE